MTDQYRNFSELQQDLRIHVDYRIQTQSRASSIMLLAIHAGGIELGTSELVKAIAGNDFSYYLFEGLTLHNEKLHITSTNFDEPQCLEMVKNHQAALAVHGFNDSLGDPLIYLGGNDHELIQKFLGVLNKDGYQTRINTSKYAATDPHNICNRSISGKGLQIEISASLRSQFFKDYSSYEGRKTRTPRFDHFVNVIRSSLIEL